MSQLPEKIREGIEKYADNAWLKMGVSNIPYIGPLVDELLSVQAGKITKERVMALIEGLSAEIKRLEESKLDKDYVNTEEFFDLLTHAIRIAIRNRGKQKLSILIALLKSSLTYKVKTVPPETFLYAIEELSERDLFVALALYELEKNISPQSASFPRSSDNELMEIRFAGWDKLPDITGLDFDDLQFHFKRLESAGLIREITGMYLGYTGGVYRITNAFKRLMEFISD